MIKAVLFDFDGTIVDSLKHHLDAYRQAFSYFNASITDEDIIKKVFYTTPLQKETILNLGIDYNLFWEIQKEYIEEALKSVEIHEHFDSVLKELKKEGLVFGIISFAPNFHLKRELEKLNLADYFQVIVGGDDVNSPKPDPEGVLKAMKKLAVSKEETIFIGDTNFDIDAGKNAGILTGLYYPIANRLYSDIDIFRLSNPDFEFESYLQLPEEIKRLNKTKS